MFFKKEKFPLILFIMASFIVLLVAVSFYFVFKINFLIDDFVFENNLENSQTKNKYFYRDNIKDPYITLKPSLKKMIKGPIISSDDPLLGNKDAQVSLVVFSDFSCSFCKSEEGVLKNILNVYQNKINLIRKDYPLSDKNSESFKAARAARCAQEENKFWDFHDLLFKYPEKRKDKDFIDFALSVGINKNIFSNCLKEKKVDQKIKNNMEEADALDIYGIPFIYINDRQIVGEINEEELKKIIEIELERK